LKNKNSITKISAGFLILTIAIFLIPNVPLAEETIKGDLKTCILGKFEKGKNKFGHTSHRRRIISRDI